MYGWYFMVTSILETIGDIVMFQLRTITIHNSLAKKIRTWERLKKPSLQITVLPSRFVTFTQIMSALSLLVLLF